MDSMQGGGHAHVWQLTRAHKILRRHKHWLPSIFELRQLRELTVMAGSTWVRLPQAFSQLANLERLTIQMQIEGGYEPSPPKPVSPLCCTAWRAVFCHG